MERPRAPPIAELGVRANPRNWVSANPAHDLPKFKIERGVPEILSVKDCKALMAAVEATDDGAFVPYFALALFAGIRPQFPSGELDKLALLGKDIWKHIDLRNKVIRINPEISKTGEYRTIKIQPNLRSWLEKYPLDRYPQIPPKNVDRILREIRQKFALGHDVLRHTYISMTVGAFRSIGDAALQAGNSEAVIRKHYLDLKSTEEAEQFWKIVPKGTRLPKLEKREGWYEPVKAKKRSKA